MKYILGLQLLIVVVVFGSWAVNFYKLTQCDFEPTYKEEVIHGVGIFPPVAVITAWYSKD